MRIRALRWSVALLLMCSACGGAPTAPTPMVTGSWEGTIESGQDGPGSVTLRITQTGSDVSGDVMLAQDGLVSNQGHLTGTVTTGSSATTMSYDVTYDYGPFHCQGSFSGTVTVSTRTLDGPFSGSNCVRAFTGFLRATKTR